MTICVLGCAKTLEGQRVISYAAMVDAADNDQFTGEVLVDYGRLPAGTNAAIRQHARGIAESMGHVFQTGDIVDMTGAFSRF